MKSLIIITFFAAQFVFAQYSSQIRVMTYNINAEKHKGGSYSDISDVIKKIAPDITGLQKVDSCNSRNTTDVLKWLGEQTSSSYTFAPAVKNYSGSTGSYGIGFLTKESPVSVRRLWIEHTGIEQDRGVLEIGITMAGEKVRVIVTHLAHEGTDYRTAQMNKIIAWIDSSGTTDPVIIMADFNAPPSENSLKLLEADGFNYVKEKNGKTLDTSSGQGINHILYRPASRWSVVDAGNPSYPDASNRNPVWADMKLTGTSVNNLPVITGNQNAFSFSNNSLQYYLSNESKVSASLFNASGQNVAVLLNQMYQLRGKHTISVNNLKLPAGLYLVVLSSETDYLAKTITLFK